MFNRLFRRGAFAPSIAALNVNYEADLDAAEQRLREAQRRVLQLEILLHERVVELDAYRAAKAGDVAETLATPTVESEGPKARRTRKLAIVAKADKPAKLTALEFWRLHGQAVDAIRAVYSDSWKVRAPVGDTELVEVAAGYRRAKTERGTILKWSQDQRFPSAKYWPGGAYPEGVTSQGDYQRHDVVEAEALWRKRQTGKAVKAPTRDAAWHEARGYMWDGADWVHPIGHFRVAAERWQALERAAVAYGPQPFADIADDTEKLAAD